MGYIEVLKGYRLSNLKTLNFIIERSVKFEEIPMHETSPPIDAPLVVQNEFSVFSFNIST